MKYFYPGLNILAPSLSDVAEEDLLFARDLKSISVDYFPEDCGPLSSGGPCGSTFVYINVYINDKDGTCGFYECSFDYELPVGQGPEGEWSTAEWNLDSIPWRIRGGTGAGCNCPFVASGEVAGISLRDALANDSGFNNDFVLGTGDGNLFVINMGAAQGADDSLVSIYYDNVVIQKRDESVEVWDFEPAKISSSSSSSAGCN